MSEFNHFDESGHVHMVDVGHKPETKRQAIATGYIEMRAETLQMVIAGKHKKGDVLAVARIAAIMASKRTAEIIPLCHPIPLTHVAVDLQPDPEQHRIDCHCTIETNAATGIEMEALHATQVALLTIYDMCKGVDRGMSMGGIRLLKKTGGKSGTWESTPDPSGSE